MHYNFSQRLAYVSGVYAHSMLTQSSSSARVRAKSFLGVDTTGAHRQSSNEHLQTLFFAPSSTLGHCSLDIDCPPIQSVYLMLQDTNT